MPGGGAVRIRFTSIGGRRRPHVPWALRLLSRSWPSWRAFAATAGCPDQSADCLRHLQIADLVSNFPAAAIPGVVDSTVLKESAGTALVAGRFACVPILKGIKPR